MAEADEGDPVERTEDVLHVDQAGRLIAGEVDLGHVAGDDDFRAEAKARQEHLHLLGRCALSLVEDDEAVEFGHKDVVRHKLVQRIVEAYKEHTDERNR